MRLGRMMRERVEGVGGWVGGLTEKRRRERKREVSKLNQRKYRERKRREKEGVQGMSPIASDIPGTTFVDRRCVRVVGREE